AKVKVQSSSKQPLSGADIKYKVGGSTLAFGTTNGDGIAIKALFAGTYEMYAVYNKTTSATEWVNVTADVGDDKIDHTFVATLVTLNFPGTIKYKVGSNTYAFKSPMALFPGKYEFIFSKSGWPTFTRNLTIGGSPVNDSFGIVALKDSKGNGLEGGSVSYYAGKWENNVATTGSDGYALLQVPAGSNPTTIVMNYKGGRAEKKMSSDTSYYEFQTIAFTVKLVDSKGEKLDGGAAKYYGGGEWRVFGTGIANSSMELLPGQYSIAVSYNGREQKDGVKVDEEHTEVVFQTGAVIFHYAGGTLCYYTGGSWQVYTDPLEMMPDPNGISFELRRSGWPAGKFKVTPEAGKVYEKTLAYIRLVDSSGKNGIKDGVAAYYDGGWYTLGNTGADGIYFAQLDGNKAKSMTFKMELGGGSNQKSQNLATDSFILFQTKGVTFRLLDSNGNDLEGGASYYAGGWKTFGSGVTKTSMELLPGSYTFKVTYRGASVQRTETVSDENKDIIFQTASVKVLLKNLSGKKELDGTSSFYAGGWQDIGPTGTPIELLPTS
ncbi:MAG: hypothetical protein GXW96_02715, partial [Christensenellaceae bacterium]|nr:hypothetical protein [Christensenellaceae bacterium]